MPAATGWNAAQNLIRRWYARPEMFTGEGEIDPPCRDACRAALMWVADMRRDGHNRMVPTGVDHGPNGEIVLAGTDSRAGNEWVMHFWGGRLMTKPEWEKFTTNGWILRVPERGLELYRCASDSSWTVVQGSRIKGFKADSLESAMLFAVQWYRNRIQRGLDETEGMV